MPLRRLAVTVLLAFGKPFTLEMEDGVVVTGRAVLLAPGVARRSLDAIDSDMVIIDFGVATAHSQAFRELLADAPLRLLDETLLATLAPHLAQARDGDMDTGTLARLLEFCVLTLTGRKPQPVVLHPRIAHALKLIDGHPMQAVSLPWLAAQVHMSASRFRHLFRHETGSSLTHFLRWTALLKAIWAWSHGLQLAQVAEAGGFYDLAHLNRAFNEAFGLSPSELYRGAPVRLTRHELA